MIKFINGKSIFPGIDLLFPMVIQPNGTPIIKDSSNRFLCCDMFPMVSHTIKLIMAYDINPIQTIKEKKYLLSKLLMRTGLYF